MERPETSKTKRTLWRKLLRPCLVVLYAFAAMGLLVALALNLSFLSPVSQVMKGFSLTDVYYHVLMDYGVPDTSRVVCIVDITDLPDRQALAERLAEVEAMKPKVVGVDIIFEGRKADSLADRHLAEVAWADTNIVFSYRMADWADDTVGYRAEYHSFFASEVAIREGFTNYERSLYGGIKRKVNMVRRCEGEERTSLVGEVAMLYSDGKVASRGSGDVNVNFRPKVFRVIHPDSIAQHRDWIEGNVVLYGAVRDLADRHYTPIGEIAGIELLAYSVQTLLDQDEVRHPGLWATAAMSFLIVLITYLWKKSYMQWANARRSQWLRFLLTTSFLVGMMLFLWTALLMGMAFLLFCLTGISLNLGWAMGAIPFLSGAKEFLGLTLRNWLH